MSEFQAPRAISPDDVLDEFDCGEPTLNSWLTRSAMRNETAGASRTLVSIHSETGRVAGFYCLSANSIVRDEAPGALARNMPNPIPLVLLGGLGVDKEYAGKGLGLSLLRHALVQALRAAETLGIRAIVVWALNDSAANFYERFGFSPFPESEHLLYLLVNDAWRTLENPAG